MVVQDESASGSPPSEGSASRPRASSPEAAGDDPLIGTVIEPYRVVRRIGRGGMGAVYEGLNTRIHKRVALKFIDARLAQNPDAVARFQREARAASAVESPNIVQIFDAGVTNDGVPFLVMELLGGRDLGQHLREVGRLGLEPALQLTAQILKALDQAHQAGIVHRDLKPDNVFLVEREGEVAVIKLLDFGVSKIARSEGVPLETLTKEGTVVGTPHYMSPEQAQGLGDVDAATDVYSAGAILFECLAGRTPHVGNSYEQVIVRICTQDAADVRELADEVPAGVAAVIARALARDRTERFASASDMLAALLEASPEPLRERMQSGVFSLALSAAAGSLPGAPRATGSGARARASGSVLTPTEAAIVGSASTVAAPIVSSVHPPAARPASGTPAPAGSEAERTAPPSTLPTYAPGAGRKRLLAAVVVGGLVVGVGLTLVALRDGGVRVEMGGPGATSHAAEGPSPPSLVSPTTEAPVADAAATTAAARADATVTAAGPSAAPTAVGSTAAGTTATPAAGGKPSATPVVGTATASTATTGSPAAPTAPPATAPTSGLWGPDR